MKILQINSVCGVGSTGRIATDLYKVLEEQGHECLIAYGRGTALEGINAYKIGTNLDNYFHVARTRLLDQHGYGSKKPTIDLIKKIKEYNPDIIHLHNLHGYYLNLRVLIDFLSQYNKPVIWTLHDCWAFTGHCAYFDFVDCQKWKIKCFDCPQKNSYPQSFVDNSRQNYLHKKELFTKIKNLTLVSPSEWLSNLVKESYLAKFPIKIINNGIDLSIFKPTTNTFKEKNNILHKKVILGVASHWEQRKGLDTFLKLSKILDENYQIVLVGLTNKQKNTLPSNIIGITKTNNVNELVEIYSAADVFINPTREDNFPTTNIEAIACGTPVITYRTGGSVESVNETCGLIIDKDDFQSLVNALKYNFPSLNKDSIVKQAQKYNKYDKYSEYINIYEDMYKRL